VRLESLAEVVQNKEGLRQGHEQAVIRTLH
jgi:hypothetical protein